MQFGAYRSAEEVVECALDILTERNRTASVASLAEFDAAYLADTNILLRISRRDPSYAEIRIALHFLRSQGTSLCFTSQNLAEFWNVCTRPAGQNGFGLSISGVNRRAQIIERAFVLLPDTPDVHAGWRRLIVARSVMGVKVHDARLVAAMHVHGILT